MVVKFRQVSWNWDFVLSSQCILNWMGQTKTRETELMGGFQKCVYEN